MYKNNLFIITISIILTLFIFLICVGIGGIFINPFKYFNTESNYSLILKLRFFRILTAFVVGGSLAISGMAYQAVLRNPLADPFILGISGGASVGATVCIVLGLAHIADLFIPGFAFVGALVVLSVVLLLARGAGKEYSTNIMLSGVIAGSICSSILMFMISVMDLEALHSVTWWMLGSLSSVNIMILYSMIALLLLSTVILYLFGRDVNALAMGEEMAYNLGISPKKVSLIILLIASLLTAFSVSMSGIIGFVGLIIPHIIRKIFGVNHRKTFIISVFMGGAFLIICDTFSRTIIYPQELPVGVITSSLGGPFFIWLLNRRKKI